MNDIAKVSHSVPIPNNVSPELVYDFDMFHDAALNRDPHARVLELLREAPDVFWTPRNGGHWIVLSHAANFQASRDTEAFSSALIPEDELRAIMARMPANSPHIPNPTPINVDPPEHGKWRAPLQGAFSPKAMLALRDDIRALADELIDGFADRSSCEFVNEFAEQLPVKVFLKMLGLPVERFQGFRTLVQEILRTLSKDPTEDSAAMEAAALQNIAGAMRETFLARREEPKDDLISALWQVEVDGRKVTYEDMENFGVLLFIAGLDTVVNGISYGIRHLAQDPILQTKLRGNPKLITEAAEEILRRYTFTVPARRIGKDTMLAGAALKKGQRAVLFLPGANLDVREFPNPELFDLDRENKVHIAFNSGPHRCLGSHLARIELQVVYEQMLARLPSFRLDPKNPPKFHGGHVIGIDSLHILWDD